MCRVVYIASTLELPTSADVENEPFFSVQKASNTEIRNQFKFPNVYCCGSNTGCGCGFEYYNIQENDIYEEENNSSRRSVTELFNYLREQIKRTKEIELYTCWNGDEGIKSKHNREIDLANFELGLEFSFEVREYICLYDSSSEGV